VAAGAGCAAYGEGAGAEEPARRQGAVRFTEMQLLPETISVGADEIVVWISEADHSAAVVVLPAETVAQLTCTELRPRFAEIADGAYQSIVMQPDAEDLGLPCPLKPGTHAYELRLFHYEYGSADDPLKTLKGRIVVQ